MGEIPVKPLLLQLAELDGGNRRVIREKAAELASAILASKSESARRSKLTWLLSLAFGGWDPLPAPWRHGRQDVSGR